MTGLTVDIEGLIKRLTVLKPSHQNKRKNRYGVFIYIRDKTWETYTLYRSRLKRSTITVGIRFDKEEL